MQEAHPEGMLQAALAAGDAVAAADYAWERRLPSRAAIAAAEEEHAAGRALQVYRPSSLVVLLVPAASRLLPALAVAAGYADVANRRRDARVHQSRSQVSRHPGTHVVTGATLQVVTW